MPQNDDDAVAGDGGGAFVYIVFFSSDFCLLQNIMIFTHINCFGFLICYMYITDSGNIELEYIFQGWSMVDALISALIVYKCITSKSNPL